MDSKAHGAGAGKNAPLFYALIGLYLAAPLPLGGNRAWAWLALAGCGFLLSAAWAYAWMSGRMPLSPALRGRPARAAVGLLLVVAAWMFCQTLPLPPAWVAALSPQTFKLYQAARAVVPPDGLPMPLSVDREATLAAGLRSLFFITVFLLLLQCLDSRRRVKMFCLAMVLSGFLQAVHGSFMALSGVDYLFFLGKHTEQGVATGTFVNRNHLAGYLEMALAFGMSLLLMKGRRGASGPGRFRGAIRLMLSNKALIRLMLVIMVSGLILTRSRMGNTAFFSSLLLTGLLAVAFSPHFRTKRVCLLLASIVLVDIFMLGQWFGLEAVAHRLAQTSLATEQRDDVDIYAVPLVEDFWLTGAGAGSFIHVFPAYAEAELGALFDHAHNDYLELLGELGVIGFVPLSAFVVLGFCQAVRMLKCLRHTQARAVGFGSCMGIISMGLHSSVDFNLQIPANAMLFLAVIAIAYSVQQVSNNSSEGSEP